MTLKELILKGIEKLHPASDKPLTKLLKKLDKKKVKK